MVSRWPPKFKIIEQLPFKITVNVTGQSLPRVRFIYTCEAPASQKLKLCLCILGTIINCDGRFRRCSFLGAVVHLTMTKFGGHNKMTRRSNQCITLGYLRYIIVPSIILIWPRMDWGLISEEIVTPVGKLAF